MASGASGEEAREPLLEAPPPSSAASCAASSKGSRGELAAILVVALPVSCAELLSFSTMAMQTAAVGQFLGAVPLSSFTLARTMYHLTGLALWVGGSPPVCACACARQCVRALACVVRACVCACVCVCVRACIRTCVRAYVRACVRVCVRNMCVHMCVLQHLFVCVVLQYVCVIMMRRLLFKAPCPRQSPPPTHTLLHSVCGLASAQPTFSGQAYGAGAFRLLGVQLQVSCWRVHNAAGCWRVHNAESAQCCKWVAGECTMLQLGCWRALCGSVSLPVSLAASRCSCQ